MSVDVLSSPELDSLPPLAREVHLILAEMAPERGYLDHSVRLVENLEGHGLATQSMREALLIHDGVALALDGEEDNPYANRMRKVLGKEFNTFDPAKQQSNRYIQGICISAHRWESAVEALRDDLASMLDTEDERWDDSSRLADALRKAAPDTDIKTTANLLKDAICDSSTDIIDDKTGLLKEPLRRFNMGINDLGAIVLCLRAFDIEGLLIKALEVEDNIANPNEAKPASQWQDIQEALSYLIPGANLAGFNDIATELKNLALQTLYRGTEIETAAEKEVTAAHNVHARVKSVMERLPRNLNFQATDGSNLDGRIKDIGSTEASIDAKGHRPADSLGFRIIIDTDNTDTVTDLGEKILHYLSDIPGFTWDHPRGIDDAWENMLDDQRRSTGYESLHINFKFNEADDDEGLYIELQITTPERHHLNETVAHHELYKAIYGLGLFGDAANRRKNGTETAEDIEFIWENIGYILSVAARTDYFRDEPQQAALNPQTIAHMSQVEYIRDNDKVSRKIAEYFPGGDFQIQTGAVITAVEIDAENFWNILDQMAPLLREDEEVLRYLDLAARLHSSQQRDMGDKDHFFGHILPSTLAVIMKHMLKNDFDHQMEIKEDVLIELFHDAEEDIDDILTESEEDKDLRYEIFHEFQTMPASRRAALRRLNKKRIVKTPEQTKEDIERIYISQLHDSDIPIKAAERKSNLRTDLEDKLRANADPKDREKALNYYKRSKYLLLRMIDCGEAGEVEWFSKEYKKHGVSIPEVEDKLEAFFGKVA